MKKSKKALLWSIVPILGISGGAAGAVAGITNHKASTSINSTVALNSADSLAKARSTNDVTNGLKIESQSYDLILKSYDLGDTLFVDVEDEASYDSLNYTWEVNKGNGWVVHTLNGRKTLFLNTPNDVDKMITWTFRCTITDTISGESITSDDMKFTVTPWEGDDIEVITQPIAHQEVNGGEIVTLNVDAMFQDGSLFEEEEVYYRWFEYDSENNKFIFIADASKKNYVFTTPYTSETQTKKYVCRFYLKSDFGNYISESNQAIVTINKSESETKPTGSLDVSSSVKSNQASVRPNFYSNNRIDEAWYEVDVMGAKDSESNLFYQWYYVGRDGKEHLIEGTKNSNKLTPNKKLFEAAYKDNSNHKVGIMCKIYKNGKLDRIIDQNTNSRFYMTVVVNNRVVRVSK